METVYEGTWEEVLAHGSELRGRQVKLIVAPSDEGPTVQQNRERLARAREMLGELNEGLGPFPDRRLTLDDYYPDDEEPR